MAVHCLGKNTSAIPALCDFFDSDRTFVFDGAQQWKSRQEIH